MGCSSATKLGKATGLINNRNCWFVQYVIKIQNYEVLDQLKNEIYTSFHFEKALPFVMSSTLEFLRFCVTQHPHGSQQSSHVGSKSYFGGFCYFNSHLIRKGTTLMSMNSLER